MKKNNSKKECSEISNLQNVHVIQWSPTPDDEGKIFEFDIEGFGTQKIHVTDLPDSVVKRPEDDTTSTTTAQRGVIIKTTKKWSRIGVEISSITNSNQVGVTVYRESNWGIMGKKSLEDKISNNTFTIDLDETLQPDIEYAIMFDETPDTTTVGYYDTSNWPFNSSDDVILILEGVQNIGEDSFRRDRAIGFKKIGNVGFDN